MDPILIAIIIILCQYPLAVFTLLKLFRSNEEKTSMILWDVFVIVVPFIGAASFWIYYAVKGRKKPKKTAVTTTDSPNSDTQTAETDNEKQTAVASDD